MTNKAKTVLIIGGVAFAAYLLSRKKNGQASVESEEEPVNKKTLPTFGGGRGGGVSPVPVSPTLAVPTSQVIIQTQPNTPVSTTSVPTGSPLTAAPTTDSNATRGDSATPPPTGSGTTTATGNSSTPPPTGSSATSTLAPSSPSRFTDFSYVDGGHNEMLDALL